MKKLVKFKGGQNLIFLPAKNKNLSTLVLFSKKKIKRVNRQLKKIRGVNR